MQSPKQPGTQFSETELLLLLLLLSFFFFFFFFFLHP